MREFSTSPPGLSREAPILSNDLDRIAAALGVDLPEDYRATLMNYPFPANPDGAGMWLVEDADLVIQSTESFRAAGGTRTTWSNNYVYLGGDGGEESYFLDVGHTPAPVLVYDYESGAVMPRCADLAGWLADLRGELEGLAADEREMNARYRRKRWWQFWIRPYPPNDAPPNGR